MSIPITVRGNSEPSVGWDSVGSDGIGIVQDGDDNGRITPQIFNVDGCSVQGNPDFLNETSPYDGIDEDTDIDPDDLSKKEKREQRKKARKRLKELLAELKVGPDLVTPLVRPILSIAFIITNKINSDIFDIRNDYSALTSIPTNINNQADMDFHIAKFSQLKVRMNELKPFAQRLVTLTNLYNTVVGVLGVIVRVLELAIKIVSLALSFIPLTPGALTAMWPRALDFLEKLLPQFKGLDAHRNVLLSLQGNSEYLANPRPSRLDALYDSIDIADTGSDASCDPNSEIVIDHIMEIMADLAFLEYEIDSQIIRQTSIGIDRLIDDVIFEYLTLIVPANVIEELSDAQDDIINEVIAQEAEPVTPSSTQPPPPPITEPSENPNPLEPNNSSPNSIPPNTLPRNPDDIFDSSNPSFGNPLEPGAPGSPQSDNNTPSDSPVINYPIAPGISFNPNTNSEESGPFYEFDNPEDYQFFIDNLDYIKLPDPIKQLFNIDDKKFHFTSNDYDNTLIKAIKKGKYYEEGTIYNIPKNDIEQYKSINLLDKLNNYINYKK